MPEDCPDERHEPAPRESGTHPRFTLRLVLALAFASGLAAATGAEAAPADKPQPSQSASLPALPGRGELRISIEGLKDPAGTVLVGLYDSRISFDRAVRLAGESGFLNDPERVAGMALRAGPSLSVAPLITGLPAGDYAVIVFHDVNGNGKLDKNAFGIPTEPYGFSNDAQGILGPPSFEDARVRLDGCGHTVAIHLIRPGADDESNPDPAPADTARIARACAGS
jgi:uncharacterized protein (DUF2141 family)